MADPRHAKQWGAMRELYLDRGDMQVAGIRAAGEPEDDLEAHQVSGHSRAHACTQRSPGSAQRSAAGRMLTCQVP